MQFLEARRGQIGIRNQLVTLTRRKRAKVKRRTMSFFERRLCSFLHCDSRWYNYSFTASSVRAACYFLPLECNITLPLHIAAAAAAGVSWFYKTSGLDWNSCQFFFFFNDLEASQKQFSNTNYQENFPPGVCWLSLSVCFATSAVKNPQEYVEQTELPRHRCSTTQSNYVSCGITFCLSIRSEQIQASLQSVTFTSSRISLEFNTDSFLHSFVRRTIQRSTMSERMESGIMTALRVCGVHACFQQTSLHWQVNTNSLKQQQHREVKS